MKTNIRLPSIPKTTATLTVLINWLGKKYVPNRQKNCSYSSLFKRGRELWYFLIKSNSKILRTLHETQLHQVRPIDGWTGIALKLITPPPKSPQIITTKRWLTRTEKFPTLGRITGGWCHQKLTKKCALRVYAVHCCADNLRRKLKWLTR